MDKRIDYKMVLDTETCPIEKGEKVNPFNMLTYDLGYIITDKRGNIYEQRSFIIYEIFVGEAEKMKSAYYADKVPKYWEQIKSGQRKLVRWATARKILLQDIEKYSINKIFAHNMFFDYNTLNVTNKWITNKKYYYYLPLGIECCDTLAMARDTILKKKQYIEFCKEFGFLDKQGRPRATAEILYRFISGDIDFIESHTGLEDTLIEKVIMVYCYQQHKKMRRILYKDNKKFIYEKA